jgi:hypothetical protein
MKFDLLGRLENLRLPDGKTAILYSVYEAVSNSLHAIEERFGQTSPQNGLITIEAQVSKGDGTLERITTIDNGIGLNKANLKAFDTSDSRRKRAQGGKGIGRLIWLKLFDRIHVQSTYLDSKKRPERVQFLFVAKQDDSLQRLSYKPGDTRHIGTEITFEGIKPGHNVKMKRASFMRDLALHFFSYFIADSMPRLSVIFGASEAVELREYIRERIEQPVIEKVKLPEVARGAEVEIVHLYVDRNLSRALRNSILLVAHNRQVEQIEIEKKFALNQLPRGKAYLAVVRGDFLDDRVDQERTGFKLTPEQHEAIHRTVLSRAEHFLENHIRSLRDTQKEVVSSLLGEHPQLALKVRNVDEYVHTLSPGMGDEDIGKTLFTLLYRDERKIAERVRQLRDTSDLSDDARAQAQETLAQVSEQAKVRLAEYVVKRRQIIDLAKSFLRYKGDGSRQHHYEKAIHDLICPMGKFFSGEGYDAHNLWIIDDLLAYYSFFASDKQLRTLVKGSDDADEPDIIFLNPMGFRREGTNDPVVLVEFKRPGDEHPTSDPVNQVLSYIEKLRNKTVKDAVTGEVISDIRETTPFECYVVCDLTEGTRRLLERSLASYETPDGDGYFGFAPKHKAAIHVVSYKKMLKDAELRNRIFFEKLGLVV